MAAKKNPIFDTATTIGKVLYFLVISAVCGVLVAGLMVPAVALTGTTASNSISLFDSLPSTLKVGAPAQSSKIVASDGSTIATFYDQNRQEVSLAQMSPYIQNGIVAIEDSRFYEHGGVDTTGMLRAAVTMLGGGSRQGASTITQQYVNNELIQNYAANGETDKIKLGSDKKAGDKVREIKLAIAVEKVKSKKQILEGYLNLVYFANNNYGIESAAEYYFGVHAKDLTLPQAAMLAGVVNSPGVYDPVTKPDNAVSRRNMVLDRMLAQKMITKKQHDDAVKSKLALNIHPAANGCAAAARAEYFCQYVENLFLNDATFGATKDDRTKLLYQGGLTIKTTLNTKLQDTMQNQVNAMVPPTDNPDKVGHSMVTVQPGTGQILAMAQNTKLLAAAGQWSDSYNFNVDRVDAKGNSLGGAGGFATGSTMKPFTLATWLQSGHKLMDVVDASRRVYPSTFQWQNSCGRTIGIYNSAELGSGIGASPDLQNAEEDYYVPVSALEGLYQSLNTATFAEASQLDFCNIQKMMTAAGIHNGGDGKSPYDMSTPANLIGSDSVSPMTMANAFATFASGGVRCDPIAIAAVTNAKGDKFQVPGANCQQTIKPEIAAGVALAMQDVLELGSGRNVPLNYPAGAKTGTTNLSEETWTVGYTKGLSTASWVGSPDSFRSINGLWIHGPSPSYVDGGAYAGQSWQAYMNKVAGDFNTSAFPTAPLSVYGTTNTPPHRNLTLSNPAVAPTLPVLPTPVAPPAPAAPAAPAAPNTGNGASGGNTGGNSNKDNSNKGNSNDNKDTGTGKDSKK